MEYIIIIGLTLMLFCSIIIGISKKKSKSFNKIVYRQSDMHNMLKDFFFKDIFDDKVVTSQSKIWREKQTTKVVIIDQKAYWVSNNMFYVGETVNGKVAPETGKPLDTTKMSKKEIDKLLFILDNLKGE
jgi:archaellin